MRFAIAWIVSNILYGMGHVASRSLYLPDRLLWDWWADPVARAYQHLMHASAAVSNWGNAGVWKRAVVDAGKSKEGNEDDKNSWPWHGEETQEHPALANQSSHIRTDVRRNDGSES